jgi:two-component system LytT family response regulator
MIKAIIVDDEINAIKSLKWEIENFSEEVEICDCFTNPQEAISAINYLKPDCVFLDIEMPQMDGFQLINSLHYKDFDLIFTTAYDGYAIQAFKVDAMDYLLKPIDSDDLKRTIEKVKKNKSKNRLGVDLKKMIQDIDVGFQKKIQLVMQGKTVFVKPDEIQFCEADGNYTTIHIKAKKPQVLAKKLKEIEAMLASEKKFYRIHHSFIVNLDYIEEYNKEEGHQVVLENGQKIPVSRSRRNELQVLLGS